MNEAALRLDAAGIRPSPQRVRIYEELAATKAHPAAETLFATLKGELPTLSRTTVYNTLGLLLEAGLAVAIHIGAEEVRYDADTSTHGHFRCRSCGRVTDFPVLEGELRPRLAPGFVPEVVQLACVGLCPGCITQDKGASHGTHRVDSGPERGHTEDRRPASAPHHPDQPPR